MKSASVNIIGLGMSPGTDLLQVMGDPIDPLGVNYEKEPSIKTVHFD